MIRVSTLQSKATVTINQHAFITGALRWCHETQSRPKKTMLYKYSSQAFESLKCDLPLRELAVPCSNKQLLLLQLHQLQFVSDFPLLIVTIQYFLLLQPQYINTHFLFVQTRCYCCSSLNSSTIYNLLLLVVATIQHFLLRQPQFINKLVQTTSSYDNELLFLNSILRLGRHHHPPCLPSTVIIHIVVVIA